ncbi:hypothetical protein VTH06DRAFT_2464 [Thermothelomyces fergusii]
MSLSSKQLRIAQRKGAVALLLTLSSLSSPFLNITSSRWFSSFMFPPDALTFSAFIPERNKKITLSKKR